MKLFSHKYYNVEYLFGGVYVLAIFILFWKD